ncbi:AI-2E family transporter [Crenobacter sp. SG2303]|uniref:AI-2E family transporter n=1 Tax=Crenobacter oryzisoli TaxID=3056844 RepID=A0ABT7XNL7_9NEIS|nr:AI-2E family transporter [Crenobacter sp. SG2303]MDN0075335.1 AI-2E family transporter [Crenobacter sp. SG2303]
MQAPKWSQQRLSLESLVRAVLVLLLAFACFKVLQPFLGALLWAGIIAISAWPAYNWLRGKLGNRSKLAALLIILLLAIAFVVPLTFMAVSIADFVPSKSVISGGLGSFKIPSPPSWLAGIPLVGDQAIQLWQTAQTDLPGLLEHFKPMLDDVGSWLLAQGAQMGKGLVEIMLAMVIAGLFLVAGDTLWSGFGRMIAKLGGHMHDDLPELVARTVRGVTTGVVGTALAQALLTVIGVAITGVSGVMLIGFLCFLVAIAQLPTLIVWAPIVAWLAFKGQTGMAVFLGLWGLLLVNSIDNFLKPYLISHGARLPLSLIFLGVIGGLLSMGLIGLFIGPTLLAVAYRLIGRWLNAPAPADPPDEQPAAPEQK